MTFVFMNDRTLPVREDGRLVIQSQDGIFGFKAETLDGLLIERELRQMIASIDEAIYNFKKWLKDKELDIEKNSHPV
jgi:hypothetical protein